MLYKLLMNNNNYTLVTIYLRLNGALRDADTAC